VEWSGSAESVISQKTLGAEHLESIYIYIYIYYIVFILKKHAECQISFRIYETCIFVLLVNEFYIIMKIEMASIVH
jgi:hypothetical protein